MNSELFSKLADALPEGAAWGDSLTPDIANAIYEAGRIEAIAKAQGQGGFAANRELVAALPLPEPAHEQVEEWSGIAINKIVVTPLFTAEQMRDYAAHVLAKAQEQSEPVARLMLWRGPAHYPVPHGGVAARTFTEYPAEEADKPSSYWKNGDALYTAPPSAQVLVEALDSLAKEFVRVFPIYYYSDPWAHDKNAVLRYAQELVKSHRSKS